MDSDLFLEILRDGKVLGRFSVAMARANLKAGILKLDDWAWHEGLSDWVPLHSILGSGELGDLPMPTKSRKQGESKEKRSGTPLVLGQPCRSQGLWFALWDSLKRVGIVFVVAVGCWYLGGWATEESGWLTRILGTFLRVAAFGCAIIAVILPLIALQEYCRNQRRNRMAKGIDRLLDFIVWIVVFALVLSILFLLKGCGAI